MRRNRALRSELRADLDRMLELERRGTRGNPRKDAKLWADKLVEVERKRAKYQEAFAADAVTLPELKAYRVFHSN
jgi:hypothetical protein